MHKYISEHNRNNIVYFIITSIALFFGYLISKIPIEINCFWIVSLPSAYGCYCFLFLLYNHFIWKIFSNKLINIPNLNGKWIGNAISDHNNIEYELKMIIKQTWLKIKIQIITSNSYSYSVSAYIYDDSSKLIYNYINEPNYNSKESMLMHRGTCELILLDDNTITGNYYNDRNRKTSGKIINLSKI